jgi:metallophosphoesterase superfamily enzyme
MERPDADSQPYRLYAVSDVHVDYKENWDWIEKTLTGTFEEDGTVLRNKGDETASEKRFANAGIIVAGDVTHKLDLLEQFLALLKRHFCDVFYVPGNHELWVFEQEANELGTNVKE